MSTILDPEHKIGITLLGLRATVIARGRQLRSEGAPADVLQTIAAVERALARHLPEEIANDDSWKRKPK